MNEMWWYATRAAGLMTWATAMVSIVLGLLMASRTLGKKPGFPWLLDLHRFVSGLSVAFLSIHLFTLWVHSFPGIEFGLTELLVPGTSEWRPLAVAWGVVAAWLMIAVEASSLIKDHIPKKWWHGIHFSSYVVAIFGTIHGLQSGSDIDNPIVRGVALVLILAVVGLTIMRVAVARKRVDHGRDRMALLAEAKTKLEQLDVSDEPPAPPIAIPPRPAVVPPALQGRPTASARLAEITQTPHAMPPTFPAPSAGTTAVIEAARSAAIPPPQHRLAPPRPAAPPPAHRQGERDDQRVSTEVSNRAVR